MQFSIPIAHGAGALINDPTNLTVKHAYFHHNDETRRTSISARMLKHKHSQEVVQEPKRSYDNKIVRIHQIPTTRTAKVYFANGQAVNVFLTTEWNFTNRTVETKIL